MKQEPLVKPEPLGDCATGDWFYWEKSATGEQVPLEKQVPLERWCYWRNGATGETGTLVKLVATGKQEATGKRCYLREDHG